MTFNAAECGITLSFLSLHFRCGVCRWAPLLVGQPQNIVGGCKRLVMNNVPIFCSEDHKCILLNESKAGEEHAIRSNQYLIVQGASATLLDPGGFGVMPRVVTELLRHVEPSQLEAIVLSHQDPDIMGGIATWLDITAAPVFVPSLWIHFLPHYGVTSMQRFIGVPDEGMRLALKSGLSLDLVPAHFLHSEGQINVYDPVAKVLFSGDIGAAMMPGAESAAFVDDFTAHVHFIERFHRRYMCGNRAARFWVDHVSGLDIDFIAPQHGPVYRGAAVGEFLEWFRHLECGMDLMVTAGQFLNRNEA